MTPMFCTMIGAGSGVCRGGNTAQAAVNAVNSATNASTASRSSITILSTVSRPSTQSVRKTWKRKIGTRKSRAGRS